VTTSKKILIVDDSKLVLTLHGNILKKLGFECSTAENGFLALEACVKTHFDLIVTDINMPKMDGYEFTKKLRAADGYGETPIVMVSTEQESQDKSRGIEAGVNVYIVKPVDAEKLSMHVKMLLGL
jgi:two-component system chemotaxis response regulator CheY